MLARPVCWSRRCFHHKLGWRVANMVGEDTSRLLQRGAAEVTESPSVLYETWQRKVVHIIRGSREQAGNSLVRSSLRVPRHGLYGAPERLMIPKKPHACIYNVHWT